MPFSIGKILLSILFFGLIVAGGAIDGVRGGLTGLAIGGGLIVLHGELENKKENRIKKLADKDEHEDGLPFVGRPRP